MTAPRNDDDLLLPDGLDRVGQYRDPGRFRQRRTLSARYSLILGYSGWFPGQLETEIEENSWLLAPLQASIVFDTP